MSHDDKNSETPAADSITDGRADQLCDLVGRHFVTLEQTFIDANRPEWAKLARARYFEMEKLRNYARALERGVCVLSASASNDRMLDELIARDDRLEAMVRKAADTGDMTELRNWLKIRVGVRFITDTAFGGK